MESGPFDGSYFRETDTHNELFNPVTEVSTALPVKETKGEHQYMIIGDKELGPYTDVGEVTMSASGDHFAFIAENQKGKWVVFNGKAQSPYYEHIYRPEWIGEEFAFLTVKNDKVVRLGFSFKEWWEFWK